MSGQPRSLHALDALTDARDATDDANAISPTSQAAKRNEKKIGKSTMTK